MSHRTKTKGRAAELNHDEVHGGRLARAAEALGYTLELPQDQNQRSSMEYNWEWSRMAKCYARLVPTEKTRTGMEVGIIRNGRAGQYTYQIEMGTARRVIGRDGRNLLMQIEASATEDQYVEMGYSLENIERVMLEDGEIEVIARP